MTRIRAERLDGGEGADGDALLLPAARSVSGRNDPAVSVSVQSRANPTTWHRRHKTVVN